jgi:hypothetical protein
LGPDLRSGPAAALQVRVNLAITPSQLEPTAWRAVDPTHNLEVSDSTMARIGACPTHR